MATKQAEQSNSSNVSSDAAATLAALDAMVRKAAEETSNEAALANKEPRFVIGWSYDVYLRKNGLPPSEAAAAQWRRFNKETAKAHVSRMAELNAAGAKTKCGRSAVWNQKSKTYDTALTARVIEPDCRDIDLVRTAVIKAQAKAQESTAQKLNYLGSIGGRVEAE